MKKINPILLFVLLLCQALAETYEMPETTGRYVRVSLSGTSTVLALAEVEVYANGENVSVSQTATQSSNESTNPATHADKAVNFDARSTTGSRTSAEDNPWWEVDLGAEMPLSKIIISEGLDSLENIVVEVLDESRATVYSQSGLPDQSQYVFLSKDLGAIWMIGDQMLLGDQDEDSTTTPRSALYTELQALGYSFTFTGHDVTNAEGLPADAAYTSHSTVTGALLADATSALPSYWTQGRLATDKPDTICIMLGSNDITNGYIENTTDRLNALLDAIYNLSGIGSPKVFLCSIPPNRIIEAQRTDTQIYNEKVAAVVIASVAQGRDISYIDLYQPLDDDFTNVMTSDNFHPNGTGNATIGTTLSAGIQEALILEDTDSTPMLFDGVRTTLSYAPEYHQYTVTIPGTSYTCTIIPPRDGVVHSSGQKPWLWRTLFYNANIGNSLVTDLTLVDEGYYSVYATSSVVGHPDENVRIKAVYDYLVNEHGFAPTFSASCMSRAAFMVFAYASAYPEQIEGIYMDNAVADALAWPAGVDYAGHIEYAPGQFYSAPTAESSLQSYVSPYGLSSLEEAVELLKTEGSPIHQLEPLAEHCVPILSICGDVDPAVKYEENDARMQANYQALGGEMTVIVEDKGHSHGQKYAENTEAFLSFVRDNTFRQSCYADFKRVVFNLGFGGVRTGGGALVQDLIEGRAALAPEVQAPEGYSFVGWDVSFDYVIEDLMVTAQYDTVEVVASAEGSETAPTVSATDLAQTNFLSSSTTGSDSIVTSHTSLFNGSVSSSLGLAVGDTITVNFDTSVNTYGYDITGIETVFGWGTAANGRSNQGYEITATFVDGSTSSIVPDRSWAPNDPAFYWTKVAIGGADGTPLAIGVTGVTLTITEPAHASGVVIAREFDVFGTPSSELYINGIPQVWLVANNLEQTVSATEADIDGDGLTAIEEYQAGTDPNDFSSALTLSGVTLTGDSVQLSWPASAGKAYRVWHSDSMELNSWVLVGSDIVADSDEVSYSFSNELGLTSENKGFFILEVQ